MSDMREVGNGTAWYAAQEKIRVDETCAYIDKEFQCKRCDGTGFIACDSNFAQTVYLEILGVKIPNRMRCIHCQPELRP